jgi:hypothetical protein
MRARRPKPSRDGRRTGPAFGEPHFQSLRRALEGQAVGGAHGFDALDPGVSPGSCASAALRMTPFVGQASPITYSAPAFVVKRMSSAVKVLICPSATHPLGPSVGPDYCGGCAIG